MISPLIKVSWGELIDKITILELKSERISSAGAVENVRIELQHLLEIAQPVIDSNVVIATARENLRRVNSALWDIEDKIRAKEEAQAFDQDFVELARSVYFTNDQRASLKRKINEVLSSEIVEEKQYTQYSGGS